MKSDVRSFRVTLRQGGNVVVEQIFTRSDVGPAQTLELTDLEPGEYELQLRYLSAVDSLLGEYVQGVIVIAGQTTLVTDPNYRNVVPDFISSRSFLVGEGGLPRSVAIADLNGDNNLDLVSAN